MIRKSVSKSVANAKLMMKLLENVAHALKVMISSMVFVSSRPPTTLNLLISDVVTGIGTTKFASLAQMDGFSV